MTSKREAASPPLGPGAADVPPSAGLDTIAELEATLRRLRAESEKIEGRFRAPRREGIEQFNREIQQFAASIGSPYAASVASVLQASRMAAATASRWQDIEEHHARAELLLSDLQAIRDRFDKVLTAVNYLASFCLYPAIRVQCMRDARVLDLLVRHELVRVDGDVATPTEAGLKLASVLHEAWTMPRHKPKEAAT